MTCLDGRSRRSVLNYWRSHRKRAVSRFESRQNEKARPNERTKEGRQKRSEGVKEPEGVEGAGDGHRVTGQFGGSRAGLFA